MTQITRITIVIKRSMFDLKLSISITFSRVITTFQGRNRIYKQKNSSSPNHVPITLETVFRE